MSISDISKVYERTVFWELFLTHDEKERFSRWKEVVIGSSIVNRYFVWLFDLIAPFVPVTIAPNVLTLAGTLAVIQAWYFCENYSDSQVVLVTVVSIIALATFWVCNGIDGIHARRTMNDSSLGELFKYVCDLVSSLFIVVVLCSLMSIEENFDFQWYCVQSFQLILLMKHFSAFMREAGLRLYFIGAGELITATGWLLMVRGFLGISVVQFVYDHTWGYGSRLVMDRFGLSTTGYVATMSPSRAAYLCVFYYALVRIGFATERRRHGWTRRVLLMILVLRGISGALRIDVLEKGHTSKRDVIFDGLFLAMVTSDLIVAKMSGRELHGWVAIMAAMVVLPHLQVATVCFVVFYYIAVFSDLMYYMNLPLLQVVRNVYCDGIYDMCHVGHKNLFRKALSLGNRLFVGVVNDTDANAYKRPPIMTAAEREAEVASCKCVTKVIPDAPCFGLTEEFIRKHRIHVVAFGQEYLDRYPNPDDDPYYKVPRKLGIASPLPRTEGLSTSDLIRRIQERPADEKKSPT